MFYFCKICTIMWVLINEVELPHVCSSKEEASGGSLETNESLLHSHQSGGSLSTIRHMDNQYLMVCYYKTPNQSSSSDKLAPEDIDPFLCTHIIVAFATIRVKGNELNFNDTAVMDTVIGLKAKNPSLKVMLSVQSWSSSKDDGIARIAGSRKGTREFIHNVLQFVNEHSLDGIDINWMFPACYQRNNFVKLLNELRIAFDTKFVLTAAVPAPWTYIDFVNVMCYDYNFYRRHFPFTGPNAPLYPRSKENRFWRTLNIDYTIRVWHAGGMPKEKIVLGIPIYGHSWMLRKPKPKNHGYGVQAVGFGSTGKDGFVSYRDVCDFIAREGTVTVFDDESRVPYAYQDTEWISFENTRSLSFKAEYIIKQGLLGAMIFSLNQDDFQNTTCGHDSTFPLVNHVKKILSENSSRRGDLHLKTT